MLFLLGGFLASFALPSFSAFSLLFLLLFKQPKKIEKGANEESVILFLLRFSSAFYLLFLQLYPCLFSSAF